MLKDVHLVLNGSFLVQKPEQVLTAWTVADGSRKFIGNSFW